MNLQDILKTSHLPALDGIRALAVFLVIFYHAGTSNTPGGLGVTIFFVLSGFLITFLLIREQFTQGHNNLKKFYYRRALRIFPAYFAFLIFSWSVDTVRHDGWPDGLLLAGFTYTMNYYNALTGHPTSSVTHMWSLAIEEQFYILWPLLFIYLCRKKAAIAVISSLIVGVMLWRSYAYLFVFDSTPYWVYNAFDTRADALLLGCLLAHLLHNPRFQKLLGHYTVSWWHPLPAMALAVLSNDMFFSKSGHYTFGFTLEALMAAIFLLQCMFLYKSKLWGWLQWRFIAWLGTISYPLYLYHGWGISMGNKLADNPMLVLLISICTAIMLASGSYYIVERPFLRLKKRFSTEPG